jgi:hypothetical protein
MKDKLGIEGYLYESELSSKLLPPSLDFLSLTQKRGEHGSWRDFVNERRREGKMVIYRGKM